MSDPKDKDPAQPEPGSKPAETTGTDRRSGRVGYDERGNSVWEWQLETGVYSRDVSTQKLKKLELDELSIVDTGINQAPAGLNPQKTPAKPAGGFNPYDNSSAAPAESGFNPYDNARTQSKTLQPKPSTPPPPRKPADLQKLEEWLKMKKRVEDAKDDDDDDNDK